MCPLKFKLEELVFNATKFAATPLIRATEDTTKRLALRFGLNVTATYTRGLIQILTLTVS